MRCPVFFRKIELEIKKTDCSSLYANKIKLLNLHSQIYNKPVFAPASYIHIFVKIYILPMSYYYYTQTEHLVIVDM